MGYYGGQGNVVRRYGGGPQIVSLILSSLLAQLGNGYTKDPNSIVFLQQLALARILAGAWSLNRRLANQGNPLRLTTLLRRLEAIYGLPKDPGLNGLQRRQRILAIEQRRGQEPDRQFVTDGLTAILGPVFVAVEYISLANSLSYGPAGNPWGASVNPLVPWYSTLNHLLVRTQKPSGMTEGQYRDFIGKANTFLDAVLEADMTFTCYHPPEGHTPINTPGGPSAGGFYLDTPNSLDFTVFA